MFYISIPFIFHFAMGFYNKYYFNSRVVSWEYSLSFLFRMQKRLSKSFLVGDLSKCLFFQKIILQSNSSRLLSIREVTQLSSLKKIPGVDGRVFLTFTDRFELSELLKLRFNNWYPNPIRNISILKKDGNSYNFKLFTISDRVWQLLVKYSLEPIYEPFFHPHSFGFRVSSNVFDLQKFFYLNFSLQANAHQKRIMHISLNKVFLRFDKDLLLGKLISPRGIKLGLFRFFNVGFNLDFPDQITDKLTLSSLLSNIVLNDLNFIHFSIRYGYQLLLILKPYDDEKSLFNKVLSFLELNRLNLDITPIEIFSFKYGFNFLDWNYRFINGLIITPSFENYQKFLLRVKHILNNSNYGSDIKALKLSLVVKDWKMYNRFCYLATDRLSLFFLKKRAFKIFNKEGKQDSYSAKKLVDKSFIRIKDSDKHFLEIETSKSPYYGHLVFDFALTNTNNLKSIIIKTNLSCIHCGLKYLF